MFSSFLNIKKHSTIEHSLSREIESTNQRGTHVYYQARYDNMICDISTEKYTQTNIFPHQIRMEGLIYKMKNVLKSETFSFRK